MARDILVVMVHHNIIQTMCVSSTNIGIKDVCYVGPSEQALIVMFY